MSTKSETTVAGAGHETVDSVHEGEKLKKILDSTRRSQAELAKAAGVTRAAVYRWVNTERFPLRMWATISTGMTRLGLNPNEIRPADGSPLVIEDLTVLVKGWTREQLIVLKRILEAPHPHSRQNLLSYIYGALQHFHG